jgi:hypothetical protein
VLSVSLFEWLRGAFASPAKSSDPELPLDIPEALTPHRRSSWVPVTHELPSPDAVASYFGGTPFLPEGQPPPACGRCATNMPLFLQLSSADLPAAVGLPFGSGILQLFCCTICDEAYEPFSKTALARVLPPETGPGDGEAVEDGVVEQFAPFVISGWTEHDDYPNAEEQLELGIALPDAVEERVAQVFPASGDKLLGWPHWVQGVEYPSCNACHRKMRYLFQIDSEDSLPWMFGDMGCGHLFVCEAHQDVLTFHWACC